MSTVGTEDLGVGHLLHDDPFMIMPCGFDLTRTEEQARHLFALPGYAELAAVRDEQVFIVDGHHYFNRPGPRLLDSLEILAEIFHPERFDFGHTGWILPVQHRNS